MQVVDDERDDELITWKVIVHKEDGVNAMDSQHIYLVDHAWTFRSNNARQMLLQHPNLLERMANLFELDHATTTDDKELLLEQVMDEKWKWAQTYSIGSAATVEDRMPYWYIIDEFGSRIQVLRMNIIFFPLKKLNFKCKYLFLHYSIMKFQT